MIRVRPGYSKEENKSGIDGSTANQAGTWRSALRWTLRRSSIIQLQANARAPIKEEYADRCKQYPGRPGKTTGTLQTGQGRGQTAEGRTPTLPGYCKHLYSLPTDGQSQGTRTFPPREVQRETAPLQKRITRAL